MSEKSEGQAFDQLKSLSNVEAVRKDKTSEIFEYQDRSTSQIKYDQMFPKNG